MLLLARKTNYVITPTYVVTPKSKNSPQSLNFYVRFVYYPIMSCHVIVFFTFYLNDRHKIAFRNEFLNFL